MKLLFSGLAAIGVFLAITLWWRPQEPPLPVQEGVPAVEAEPAAAVPVPKPPAPRAPEPAAIVEPEPVSEVPPPGHSVWSPPPAEKQASSTTLEPKNGWLPSMPVSRITTVCPAPPYPLAQVASAPMCAVALNRCGAAGTSSWIVVTRDERVSCCSPAVSTFRATYGSESQLP